MELYILDSAFRRETAIDAYKSLIWTERYSDTGDFVITVAATPKAISTLVEGKFVSNDVSREVGLIDSVHKKDGVLTIKGEFLTGYLKHRVVRSTRVHTDENYHVTGVPGAIVNAIVSAMCITGGSGTAGATPPIPGGTYEVITNLSLGGASATGPSITRVVPFGDIYSAVKEICEEYELGFCMWPDSVSPSAYTLKFENYEGRDLTRSNGGAYPVVAFSDALDTLQNVEELRSLAGWRNTCFAYAKGCVPSTFGLTDSTYGLARTDASYATKIDFERRTMIVIDTTLTSSTPGLNSGTYKAALDKIATDALANNNFVKLMDGQLVPQTAFKYGTDYKLGDKIELNASSGMSQVARITEYIRADDEAGERAYPTLSVIA